MWWMIAGLASLTLLAAGAVWMLVPTIRTFREPEFEPTSKDEVSVLLAQQPGIPNTGR